MTPEAEEPVTAPPVAEAAIAEPAPAPADAEAGADEADPGDHPGDIPFEQAAAEHENPELA